MLSKWEAWGGLSEHQEKLTRLFQELHLYYYLEWYPNYPLIIMKLALIPCRMPWGESTRDGRSGLCLSKGQGKHEGISSHEDASPSMFTVHMGEFLDHFPI